VKAIGHDLMFELGIEQIKSFLLNFNPDYLGLIGQHELLQFDFNWVSMGYDFILNSIWLVIGQ